MFEGDTVTGFVGYFASGMVLLTFLSKDMRQLRIVGIFSNVAFIGYGLLGGLPPILFLHLVLLPVNVTRLMQMQKASSHDFAGHISDARVNRFGRTN
jgi:hypothetical protein